MLKVAAILFAHPKSFYHTLPDVEVFDRNRDARTFDGSLPVVAHPPCRAWSAYTRHQSKPAPGEKQLAPWAVEIVRSCGGVLEHPARSRLWDELNLPKPLESPRGGLWSMAVDQSWWGAPMIKRTWLLFGGLEPDQIEIPFRLHDPRGDVRVWNSKSKEARAATPPEFARWLISVAKISRRRNPADSEPFLR